ncbi:MAG TPA: FtsX-like permease family protein, partial [Gemmatimonadales bacterium]|nr:FtsX-like permease family protein [Gemmatimonadales bacterium]
EPLAKVRGSATVVARVTGQPEAILGLLLQTAAAVDPDVPVANASSVMAQFVESAGRQVFTMRLLIAFAALAVGLAAVGLYGVLRHVVGQRTRELGIRMALGATDRDIVKLILGAGALTASVGVALGAPLAYGGTWLLRSQLFGVSRADFLTYTIAAVILGLVTFVAAYTPARRAARVHSADAIRTE